MESRHPAVQPQCQAQPAWQHKSKQVSVSSLHLPSLQPQQRQQLFVFAPAKHPNRSLAGCLCQQCMSALSAQHKELYWSSA